MTMELIALITVGVAIITVGIGLAGLILNGQRNQREDMKSVQKEITGLRERMAHLEGLLEGLRDVIIGGRRPAVAEAVAEDPGQYEQR